MQVKVTVTTEVTATGGEDVTTVTTTTTTSIGDNVRFLRSEIANSDVYRRSTSQNLDGVEGAFAMRIARMGGAL